MERYSGPLIVIAFGLGFLLLVVVNFGPLAGGRGRPLDLLSADNLSPVVIDDRSGMGVADAEVVETYDLATTRPERLADLVGRRARFHVVMDSSFSRRGGRDVFEAVVRDRDHDFATVWLYAGGSVDDDFFVEATVRVVHHPPGAGRGGERLTEYRLLDAISVGR